MALAALLCLLAGCPRVGVSTWNNSREDCWQVPDREGCREGSGVLLQLRLPVGY